MFSGYSRARNLQWSVLVTSNSLTHQADPITWTPEQHFGHSKVTTAVAFTATAGEIYSAIWQLLAVVEQPRHGIQNPVADCIHLLLLNSFSTSLSLSFSLHKVSKCWNTFLLRHMHGKVGETKVCLKHIINKKFKQSWSSQYKTRFGTKLPHPSHNGPINLVYPRYMIMVLAAAVNMVYAWFWVTYSTKSNRTRCLTLPGTEWKVGGCSIWTDIYESTNEPLKKLSPDCAHG